MYINNRGGEPLILASASPRRKALLEQVGISFEVIPADVPEMPLKGVNPAEETVRIALEKGKWVAGRNPDGRWILAADTIVIIDNAVLGKPGDEAEARSMLKSLSGRWHKVITGWCVINHAAGVVEKSGSVESRVFIKKLDDGHIDAYVSSGEPMDKAGSYAVQGIGAFMVERIEGSYTNVVGLPMCEVIDALEDVGAIRLG